jgi:pyruvate formate lyase activating enzyme
MAVGQVMAEIEQDLLFYEQSGGGVTFSGGEPLMQPSFLRALLEACKAKGIHTALDTCGYAPWATIDALREDVDLFLYDLKLLNDAQHRRFTGVSNELILDNLRLLAQKGHNVTVRVPIIPGITDDKDNLRQIGAFVASLPRLKQVDLLPYHHTAIDKYRRLDLDYELRATRPPSQQRMESLGAIFRAFALNVTVGG